MLRILAVAALVFSIVIAGTFGYHARAQAQQPPPAQPAGPVHVITFVDITPNNKDAGTELLKQYITDTRKDPGVTRAELLVQANRPNHLMLDIVYQNQAAYDKHVEAQHTKDFMGKMIPIIGAPFDERPHYVLQ